MVSAFERSLPIISRKATIKRQNRTSNPFLNHFFLCDHRVVLLRSLRDWLLLFCHADAGSIRFLHKAAMQQEERRQPFLNHFFLRDHRLVLLRALRGSFMQDRL